MLYGFVLTPLKSPSRSPMSGAWFRTYIPASSALALYGVYHDIS